jgi:hypothetical protein
MNRQFATTPPQTGTSAANFSGYAYPNTHVRSRAHRPRKVDPFQDLVELLHRVFERPKRLGLHRRVLPHAGTALRHDPIGGKSPSPGYGQGAEVESASLRHRRAHPRHAERR